MKKLFLLLLPVVIFSCKGVEQYRAGIEALATEWDSVTASVGEFKNSLNSDLSELSKAASDYNLSEEAKAKLSADQSAQWQAAQQAFTQSLQAYAPIRTGVTEFEKTWAEKSAEVQALKDGLASGKLEGDVSGQVAGLTALVNQAKEMLSGWQTARDAAKTGTQAALDALKSVYEQLSAAAASAKK